MNPPRRGVVSHLKPLDASQVANWQEPLFVHVTRAKGVVSETILLPPGSGANQAGMGYTKQEVLGLNEWLLQNYGAGLYTWQVVDATNASTNWSSQLGTGLPQPSPPPAIPLGAGNTTPPWNVQAQQSWASLPQQTWAPQPPWLQQPQPSLQPAWNSWTPSPPPWSAPSPGSNMMELLLARLLDDKDKQQKDPMHMIMMQANQNNQAFDQRMAQFQTQMQQTLQQFAALQSQQKGLDLGSLFEKLPILLPILLPFLKKDDSQKDAMHQLRMEMERRDHQAKAEALASQIEAIRRDAQNGKSSEFLPMLQMLQNQHVSELQMMAERQRAVESKAPGWTEMMAMFQTLKPNDNPVVDGMRQVLELAMSTLGGGGDRSFGEVLVEGVKDVAGKIVEAKAAAATAHAMASMKFQDSALSGPPKPGLQPQALPSQGASISQAAVLQVLQNIQQGATEFVRTSGVSGMAPEEVALHIDQIAQELTEAGVPVDQSNPLLYMYTQGCALVDSGESPNPFWAILSQILPGIPQAYQQEVFQALIALRRGGADSEQGAQEEEREEEGR